MTAEYWWIWMIIAAVFVVAEILTAGFFLLWFGVGAAVAGLLALLGLGPAWQLTIFVIVSAGLFMSSRRFAERFTQKQPAGVGADRFIDKRGVVIEAIDRASNTGRVRIDREEWRADSETGAPIDNGTNVVVTRVDGTRVIVRPSE